MVGVIRGRIATSQVLVRAAVVLLVALGARASFGQQPQFRIEVEVVQLQVSVSDSNGLHLPRLERDDFALRVNGQLRDLTAVYEVDLRGVADPEAVESELPPAGWRQFLLFFDFSFSTRQGVIRAQQASLEFISHQTNPRDLIGVVTYSNIGGLKLVSPFTNDREQVLDAVRGFGLDKAQFIVDPAGFAVQPLADLLEMEENAPTDVDSNGVEDDPLTIQRQTVLDELFVVNFTSEAQDFRRYRERVVDYASQLAQLGPLLRATNGRKHVLLFSAGFDDKVLTGQSLAELAEDTDRMQQQGALGMASVNSESRFGSSDLREVLQKAVEQFRYADVVFHAFDTGGLGNEKRDDTFATTASGKQGLSYIADGTGGSVTWNANDLTPHLQELADSTARYYVIAYRKMPDDPEVVDLEIDILKPGAQMVSAPRRFAPPPAYADMDEAQRQLQLSEFVTKGIEEEDMTFDVSATPFVGTGRISRVAVVVEVPFQQLRAIAQERGDGRVELDVLGYVLDEGGQMRDVFSRRVKLNMDQVNARMDGLPFRYYDLMWAVAGPHRVRVLVRDAEVGRLSTRTLDVLVPAFEGSQQVLVSGPVAIDADHPGLLMRGMDPAAPPAHRMGGPIAYPFTLGDQDITPQVYTVTTAGGSCQFMMVAYNVAKHPFTGQTQTSMQAHLIDELGTEHALASLRLVGRSYDDATNGTTMVLEAMLSDTTAPGAYLMEIELLDAVGGQKVHQVLPLLVRSDVTTSY